MLIEFKDLDWEDKTLELNVIREENGVKVMTVTKIVRNHDYDGTTDVRPYINVIIGEIKVPFLFEYYVKEMMWYAANTSKEFTQKQMKIAIGIDHTTPVDAAINNFTTEYNKIKEIRSSSIYNKNAK